MKQLGVLDSAFVNLEQNNTPQHVGGLGIYDPSTAPGGFVRFKQVIASFERRLNRQPMFRTRLVEVPGGLDRPYWVKDAQFDVEFHLRHIALPEPGDWRQLCIQVARLHARPLDMSRPLWEAYIIEGLDKIPKVPARSFAIYTKMHHSLVDGAGGAAFMSLLHDLEADPPDAEAEEEEPRLVDREPSPAELLSRASINSIKNGVSFLRGTASNTRAMGKYLLDIARKEIPAPDISAPKTILNRPVGPHRVFDAAEFPLAGFKQIKDAGNVTINDVALTVVGGALARYLDQRGEDVEGSLAASIPVNMRTRRDVTDENNQVGAISCSLHSDETDPIRRLRQVNASAALAKQDGEVSPMVDIMRIAGAVSPALAKSATAFWSRNALSQYLPVNVSTVVTNVPGPNFPLYCAGARMVDYYGLGVLTPGMGIFHAVFSYAGKITLSVLGDRDTIPDPEVYRACLQAAYEELHQASLGLRPAPAGRVTEKSRRGKAAGGANRAAAGKKRATAAKSGAKVKARSKTKVKAKSKTKAKVKTEAKAKVKSKAKARTNNRVNAKVRAQAKVRAGAGVKARPKARPKHAAPR